MEETLQKSWRSRALKTVTITKICNLLKNKKIKIILLFSSNNNIEKIDRNLDFLKK